MRATKPMIASLIGTEISKIMDSIPDSYEDSEAMKEFLANIQATLPILRKYIKEIEKLNKEELAKQYLKAAKELKSNGEYTGPMVAKIG